MKCLFKVLPQHLNGVQVRTFKSRAFPKASFVSFEPFRGRLALLFRITVFLHNPVALHLQITDWKFSFRFFR